MNSPLVVSARHTAMVKCPRTCSLFLIVLLCSLDFAMSHGLPSGNITGVAPAEVWTPKSSHLEAGEGLHGASQDGHHLSTPETTVSQGSPEMQKKNSELFSGLSTVVTRTSKSESELDNKDIDHHQFSENTLGKKGSNEANGSFPASVTGQSIPELSSTFSEAEKEKYNITHLDQTLIAHTASEYDASPYLQPGSPRNYFETNPGTRIEHESEDDLPLDPDFTDDTDMSFDPFSDYYYDGYMTKQTAIDLPGTEKHDSGQPGTEMDGHHPGTERLDDHYITEGRGGHTGTEELEGHYGIEKHGYYPGIEKLDVHSGTEELDVHSGTEKHGHHPGTEELGVHSGTEKHGHHSRAEELDGHTGTEKLDGHYRTEKHGHHPGTEKHDGHPGTGKLGHHAGTTKHKLPSHWREIPDTHHDEESRNHNSGTGTHDHPQDIHDYQTNSPDSYETKFFDDGLDFDGYETGLSSQGHRNPDMPYHEVNGLEVSSLGPSRPTSGTSQSLDPITPGTSKEESLETNATTKSSHGTKLSSKTPPETKLTSQESNIIPTSSQGHNKPDLSTQEPHESIIPSQGSHRKPHEPTISHQEIETHGITSQGSMIYDHPDVNDSDEGENTLHNITRYPGEETTIRQDFQLTPDHKDTYESDMDNELPIGEERPGITRDMFEDFEENYINHENNNANPIGLTIPGRNGHPYITYDDEHGEFKGYSTYESGRYFYYDYYYDYREVSVCAPENSLCDATEIATERSSPGRVNFNGQPKDAATNKWSVDIVTDNPNGDVEENTELISPTKSVNIDLGLKVLCDGSVKVQKVSQMVDQGCRIRTTEIIIRHQMELCRISTHELANFHNVTYLAITDSGLQVVEDGAFAHLSRLHSLDLRNNQLVLLSWRTLWRYSVLGEHLRHLNVSGNPLNFQDCQNAWLIPWKTRSWARRKSWLEELLMDVEGKEEEDNNDSDEGVADVAGLWEEHRSGNRSVNLTRDTSANDECFDLITSSSSTSSSGCYLCPANLTVIEGNNETGVGQCHYTLVRCSARGNPLPQIDWNVPGHLVIISVQEERPDNFTFISTLNLTYTSTGTGYYYHPLVCISQNNRYVSQELIDLSVQQDAALPPQICWTQFEKSAVYEKFEYVAQAQPPRNITWWYYPCKGNPMSFDGKGRDLTHYYNETNPHSSFMQGYLRFPDKMGGGKKTGHYELQISNAHGTARFSYILNQRPKPDSCEKGDAFEIDPQSRRLKSHSPFPIRPRPAEVPCTANNPSDHTHTPATTTPTPPMTTPTPPVPLPIILTISAAILVFGVTLVLIVLRNIFGKRGRPGMHNDPCPDSPFQITFMR